MNWSRDYSIGEASLDDHHQEIFKLISRLDSAIFSHDRDQVEAILKFLEGYVVEHFNEEESLMKTHAFSGLSEHQEEHAIFKEMVSDIRDEYNQQKLLAHLAYKLRRFIDTLISHIVSTDIKIRGLETPDVS